MSWNITDEPQTEALVQEVFADLVPQLWGRAEYDDEAYRRVEIYVVVDRKGYRHRISAPSDEESPYFNPHTVRFGIEISIGEHFADGPVSAIDTVDGPGVRITLEFDKEHPNGKAIAELIAQHQQDALSQQRQASLREIERLQRQIRTIDDSLSSADKA